MRFTRSIAFAFSFGLHFLLIAGTMLSSLFLPDSPPVSLNKPVYEVRLVKARKPKSKPVATVQKQKSQAKKISAKKKPVKKKPAPTKEQILAAAMKEVQKKAAQEKAQERKAIEQEMAKLKEQFKKEGEARTTEGSTSTTKESVYSTIVSEAIRKNWRFPVFGMNPNLQADAEVILDPTGKIVDYRILNSSGRSDFDSSILRAIEETAQVQEPPIGTDKLVITFYEADLRNQ